jgi:hypothetical protein
MSDVYDLVTELSESTIDAFEDPCKTIAIFENFVSGLERHLDLDDARVTKLKNYLRLNIDIVNDMGKALRDNKIKPESGIKS